MTLARLVCRLLGHRGPFAVECGFLRCARCRALLADVWSPTIRRMR